MYDLPMQEAAHTQLGLPTVALASSTCGVQAALGDVVKKKLDVERKGEVAVLKFEWDF